MISLNHLICPSSFQASVATDSVCLCSDSVSPVALFQSQAVASLCIATGPRFAAECIVSRPTVSDVFCASLRRLSLLSSSLQLDRLMSLLFFACSVLSACSQSALSFCVVSFQCSSLYVLLSIFAQSLFPHRLNTG